MPENVTINETPHSKILSESSCLSFGLSGGGSHSGSTEAELHSVASSMLDFPDEVI